MDEYMMVKIAAHAYWQELNNLIEGYGALEKEALSLSNIGQGLSQAAGTMGRGVTGAFGQFGEAAGDVGQGIQNVSRSVGRGGGQMLGTAKGNLAQMGNAIQSGSPTQIGRALVQGPKGGMDAFGRAAQGVGGALKGHYGQGGNLAQAFDKVRGTNIYGQGGPVQTAIGQVGQGFK